MRDYTTTPITREEKIHWLNDVITTNKNLPDENSQHVYTMAYTILKQDILGKAPQNVLTLA